MTDLLSSKGSKQGFMTFLNFFACFKTEPAATNSLYLRFSDPNVRRVPDDSVHKPSQNAHANFPP